MPRKIAIALAVVLAAPAAATLADLEALMEKQEGLVLTLASQVEQQHRLRCGLTVSDCQGMSYDNCGTRYPCQTCPADGLDIAACGTGKGGLFDYTVSSVRLAGTVDTDGDNNPRDDEVKETVCYTRHLDDWFVSTNADNQASQVYGDQLPQLYFGGHNGAFRIYPARHSETCGNYDTRERPWYVAASSGPKDVVLVLDTSGSMSSYDRIGLIKTATKDVIDALTIGDHFGVVEFNSGAQTLNPGGRLLQATVENKDSIKALVDNLAAGGGTNFYNGFYAAFDLLDTSTANEFTSNCHTAILFLTDGDGGSTGLYDMINQRNAAHDATVFTYSLGSGANDVVPKQIACETGGLWAEVPDGDDLSSYMTGYYKLLAMGLGDGANEGFTAWVEPYAFSTGGGMGTTVSAPVYDRSASPPLFIGVAGIDYTVDFMQEVAGSSYATVLNALVTQSTARCPDFTISECELQALRKLSGGTEAMCAGECTALTEIEPTACLGSSDYPSNFWANLDDQGMSYTDRVCCDKSSSEGCYDVGSRGQSEGSKKKGGLSSGGAIAIGVCVAIAIGAAIALGIGFWQKSKSVAPQNQTPSAPPAMAVAEPVEAPLLRRATSAALRPPRWREAKSSECSSPKARPLSRPSRNSGRPKPKSEFMSLPSSYSPDVPLSISPTRSPVVQK